MKQKDLVEVRKADYNKAKPWVVDVITDPSIVTGYVHPDGTTGSRYDYTNKLAALSAASLYCTKHAEETVEITTSVGESQASRARRVCLKETNPKDVIGMKKVPMSTLSCAVLFEMALGMLEGARKYGRHNYRAMGVSATVYYDAAVGHLMDWFEGEDIDPDSGLSHITKAMTALLVLRDSMLMGNWIDDRPLRNPNKLYKKHFNPKAAKIIEKYPNSVVPYLETNKGLDRSK